MNQTIFEAKLKQIVGKIWNEYEEIIATFSDEKGGINAPTPPTTTTPATKTTTYYDYH